MMFVFNRTIPLFQVDQYQNFGISFGGKEHKVKGVHPSAENVADHGGLCVPHFHHHQPADPGGGRALYRVYDQLPDKDKQCVPGFNFTSNQLFWVKFCVVFVVVNFFLLQLGYSFYFCTAREGHENIKDYIDLLTDLPV